MEPLVKTAMYRLKREDPRTKQLSAMQWLVSRNPAYGKGNNKPNFTKIAEAAGLVVSTISQLDSGQVQLGGDSIAGLVFAGMLAGASRAECEENLFDFIPPPGFRLVPEPRVELVAA